jgi:hypothetical protein
MFIGFFVFKNFQKTAHKSKSKGANSGVVLKDESRSRFMVNGFDSKSNEY